MIVSGDTNFDRKIRLETFTWLKDQVTFHGDILPRSVLEKGCVINGERIPLIGPQGIFKPRLCAYPISITTSPNSPYDDRLSLDGLLQYRYRGTAAEIGHRDNIGLRAALMDGVPLIYFHGLSPGRYLATWPAFIVGDNPAELTFTVAIDDAATVAPSPDLFLVREDATARRRYVTTVARRRLHQQSFRERVLTAYNQQCSICQLRHGELLDAAHIVPDRDPEGDPIVNNGIALCKLHHAAFDASILGVSPDYVVEIREDILMEKDGPMLEHGLQRLNGSRLVLPRKSIHWPDRDRLAERYEVFRHL